MDGTPERTGFERVSPMILYKAPIQTYEGG